MLHESAELVCMKSDKAGHIAKHENH